MTCVDVLLINNYVNDIRIFISLLAFYILVKIFPKTIKDFYPFEITIFINNIGKLSSFPVLCE